MTQFECGGQVYRAGKLNAFTQFHVSRRIAPIIPTLIPVFLKLSREGSLQDDLAGLAEVLQPFTDGIASMSDESSEYVIASCLSVVQRQTGNNTWASVWNQQGKTCMFDDMDLGVMIQVMMRVIQDSLGPFITGLLTSQQSGPESPQLG